MNVKKKGIILFNFLSLVFYGFYLKLLWMPDRFSESGELLSSVSLKYLYTAKISYTAFIVFCIICWLLLLPKYQSFRLHFFLNVLKQQIFTFVGCTSLSYIFAYTNYKLLADVVQSMMLISLNFIIIICALFVLKNKNKYKTDFN